MTGTFYSPCFCTSTWNFEFRLCLPHHHLKSIQDRISENTDSKMSELFCPTLRSSFGLISFNFSLLLQVLQLSPPFPAPFTDPPTLRCLRQATPWGSGVRSLWVLVPGFATNLLYPSGRSFSLRKRQFPPLCNGNSIY